MNTETVRQQFRPPQITTLFVGESAPISGDFFYLGNTQMKRYMQRAIEHHFGESDNFLTQFRRLGWYLDDLVLAPVNHLDNAARKAQCFAARESLAGRIAEYQPLAIVGLLHRVRDDVAFAAAKANSNVPIHFVPFPGFGQQGRFHEAMIKIVPQLPIAKF
jgi:hypothetical protein